MKLPHLIAILAAGATMILMAGGAALGVYKWRQARDEWRGEMDLRVAQPADGIDKKTGLQETLIDIDSEGRFVVDGKITTEEEILSKLTALVERNENQPIRLRGSGDTTWQSLVDAIDIVEKSGIWNISFATQKSTLEASPAPAPE